jgi:hypothetical protein
MQKSHKVIQNANNSLTLVTLLDGKPSYYMPVTWPSAEEFLDDIREIDMGACLEEVRVRRMQARYNQC